MGATATSGETRGERTRATVLAAARDRFTAEGFDGTTVARIADDAGVSQPTVLFHFGSKAGLLVAVMQEHYAELIASIDDVVDAADVPEARLREFARWWLRRNAEDLDLLAVFGRHGRRSEEDEVVAAFRDANRRVTRVFDRIVEDLKHVGVLRQEVPTRIVRDAFFGTAEHVLLGWASTGRPADLDVAAEDLIDLILHGAARPSPDDRRGDLATLDAKLDLVLDRLPRA